MDDTPLLCACGAPIPIQGGILRFVPADLEVESFYFHWLKGRWLWEAGLTEPEIAEPAVMVCNRKSA